jgi:hypothetical protein
MILTYFLLTYFGPIPFGPTPFGPTPFGPIQRRRGGSYSLEKSRDIFTAS